MKVKLKAPYLKHGHASNLGFARGSLKCSLEACQGKAMRLMVRLRHVHRWDRGREQGDSDGKIHASSGLDAGLKMQEVSGRTKP